MTGVAAQRFVVLNLRLLAASFALVGILGYLGLIVFSFWNLYQEGTTGQTVGKKSQGVKLVGLENGGQPIGFGMAFVRSLVNGIAKDPEFLKAVAESEKGGKLTSGTESVLLVPTDYSPMR